MSHRERRCRKCGALLRWWPEHVCQLVTPPIWDPYDSIPDDDVKSLARKNELLIQTIERKRDEHAAVCAALEHIGKWLASDESLETRRSSMLALVAVTLKQPLTAEDIAWAVDQTGTDADE